METKKRDEMIDKFIRRQAVIKEKFKNISEAPKSIQEEYYSLNTLVDSLKSSRRNIWGQTIASDGTEIDKFVEKKYEEALEKYSKYNEENSQFISAEEEANFEFPNIDFAKLDERAKGIKTEEDYINLNDEIMNLNNQILPEDMTKKLYEIQNNAAKSLQNANKEIENKKEENLPAVKESIQSKILSKIKETIGKIRMSYEKRRLNKIKKNQDEVMYEKSIQGAIDKNNFIREELRTGTKEEKTIIGAVQVEPDINEEWLFKGSDITKKLDAFADKLGKEKSTDEEFGKYVDGEKHKETAIVEDKEK